MVTNLLKLNPHLSSPVKILDFIINGSKITNLDERININKGQYFVMYPSSCTKPNASPQTHNI